MNFLEEVYETVETIDNKDLVGMREELGDVLFQVVFHSRIAEEDGWFDLEEVCDEICRKMIIRHPHVFGDRVFDSDGKALKDWEAIKANSHSFTTATETLEAIPRTLPALMRADKLGKKSRKFGFDWEANESLSKVDDELAEVKEAIAEEDFAHIEEEFGDLLLSTVNAARLHGVDPELALTKACEKYLRRFASVEAQSLKAGMKICDNSRENLLSYWKNAKSHVT
ncbi:MAG: nucleoside triphosphate pyrophosphohydrolase [Clostridia bacterium]|nr:nucleoside triphosphate pyrophosphohydrolase [Clostridia bacterium]